MTFASTTKLEGTVLTLVLQGEVDLDSNEALQKLLDDVHAEARRSSAREVVILFDALEFMNSSAIKAFVTWIREVGDLAPSDAYKIRFVLDRAKVWQRRSLQALSAFGESLVTLS